MTHSRRATGFVLAGMLLGLAPLTACGGGSAAPSAARSDAVQLVLAAPDRTTRAGSARFAMTVHSAVSGQSIVLHGSGVFAFARRVGRLDFTIPGGLLNGSIKEIILGRKLFISIPNLTPAGKYAAINLSQLVGNKALSSFGNTDPSASLQILRGASDDITRVGRATVRGAATTHYRGTIEAKKVLARIPPRLLSYIRPLLGNISSFPFDAYIDRSGRLRRLVEKLTVPGSSLTNGQDVDVTSSFDMFDFGVAVHVTAPPKRDVIDGSSLLGQYGG
jgi:hypothetical protein